MNARLQFKILVIKAAVLLLAIASIAAWLGRDVLNPIRTVTLTASGNSILAASRTYFKTPAIGATVGQPVNVPVYIDTNGGSLASISAEFHYNPVDMSVALGSTTGSVCSAYTRRDHDEISGKFVVSCTAPTTVGSQVAPFLTFIVTPRRPGGLPIELVGRSSDYGVVTAQ